MKFLLFLRFLYEKNRTRLLISVALLILLSLVEVSAILSITPVIDLLTKVSPEGTSDITRRMLREMDRFGIPGTIINFVILFLSLNILKSIFRVSAQWVIDVTRARIMRNLICETYSDFLYGGWNFFVNNGHGTIGNTLIREVGAIAGSFYVIANILAVIFRIIFYLFIALYISWEMFIIVLILIAALLGPFLYLGRVAYRLGQNNRILSNQVFKIIQETLSAAKIIIGYGQEHSSIRSLNNLNKQQVAVELRSSLLKNTSSSAMEPIGFAILIITSYIATQYYEIPLSEIFIMVYALRDAIPLISQTIVQKNEIQGFLPAWEQVSNLRTKAQREVRPFSGVPFQGFDQAIAFENISFSYPANEPVLDQIDLIIPKGKMIALAGPSGGGKTTLIDLLICFYDPSSGNIVVDGRPLSAFDVNSWRQSLGYVPQESILFDMTIKENLLWSVDTASDAELSRACQLAQAYDFIQELPQKYNTLVGDRGVRLSGGQRQRVALARAILRNPELLVLDEATSALDSESELYIQQAIEEISKETTVLVVAHRLSTIANADCIYVLENGRIVERGTFDQLSAAGGSLFKAARLQGLA